MPGGASNTGAEWINLEFGDENPTLLDHSAESLVPTRITRYPLVREGERFPFLAPGARGFSIGHPGSRSESFASGLEGLAMLERLSYDVLGQIGARLEAGISITGGAARSDLWSLIRASALGKTLIRPLMRETAMGAALLAASAVWYGSLAAAASGMVRYDREFEPLPHLVEAYHEKYLLFRQEMTRRAYIPP